MIPDMHRLLERIQGERGEKDFQINPIMRVRECQGAINTACRNDYAFIPPVAPSSRTDRFPILPDLIRLHNEASDASLRKR